MKNGTPTPRSRRSSRTRQSTEGNRKVYILVAVVLIVVVACIAILQWGKKDIPLQQDEKTAQKPQPEKVVEPPKETHKPVKVQPKKEPPKEPELVIPKPEKVKTMTVWIMDKWREWCVNYTKSKRMQPHEQVHFLTSVCGNFRDKEKWQDNTFTALRHMLGLKDEDVPTVLAHYMVAHKKARTSKRFFDENAQKAIAAMLSGDAQKPEPKEEVKVLEDRWKPNRIRWGFPLDTPIADLQEFRPKINNLKASWSGFLIAAVRGAKDQNGKDLDDTRKQELLMDFRDNVIGTGIKLQEKKACAGFASALGLDVNAKPKAVVEALEEKRRELESDQEFGKWLGEKDRFKNAIAAARKATVQ